MPAAGHQTGDGVPEWARRRWNLAPMDEDGRENPSELLRLSGRAFPTYGTPISGGFRRAAVGD